MKAAGHSDHAVSLISSMCSPTPAHVCRMYVKAAGHADRAVFSDPFSSLALHLLARIDLSCCCPVWILFMPGSGFRDL